MCILLHLSKSNVLQFFAFTEEVYELLTVKLYSILNLHSICNKTWYFLVLMIKNFYKTYIFVIYLVYANYQYYLQDPNLETSKGR